MEKTTNLINIESLRPGSVLTDDIYYYNRNILLYKKGTVLTKEKINRLKKFGLISIKAEVDSLEEVIEKPEIIVQKKIELDFNKIYSYANDIVTTVFENKDIKKILSKIDDGVNDHSHKVAILATMLGMNIENFSNNDLEKLAVSSLLHDVGKSTIDYAILNKPGRLTPEEYEIVKQHSQKGYDILNATGMFESSICDAVLSHHENEDGTGYPHGIKGDEIPLYARIIHICDVYAALTTKRCYKEAWHSDKAISILEEEKKNYEQNLLKIFKTSLPVYMKDDVVYLSSGELATVIKTTNDGMLVKTFGDQKVVRIEFENESNGISVRKKIRA